MKKLFLIIMCSALLIGAVGCVKTGNKPPENTSESTHNLEPMFPETTADTKKEFSYLTSNEDYTVLPVEEVNFIVDTLTIETYLKRYHSNYYDIRRNIPNILDTLVNVTPEPLKRICSIYKFPVAIGTSLGGVTLMIYNCKVYELGDAYGGFGVTEFAYKKTGEENILYYIYSFGSGIHRSHIGSFNFKTYEQTVSEPIYDDIAFYIAEDSENLGICSAEIWWKNYWDTFEVTITKGAPLYDSIDDVAIEVPTETE